MSAQPPVIIRQCAFEKGGSVKREVDFFLFYHFKIKLTWFRSLNNLSLKTVFHINMSLFFRLQSSINFCIAVSVHNLLSPFMFIFSRVLS